MVPEKRLPDKSKNVSAVRADSWEIKHVREGGRYSKVSGDDLMYGKHKGERDDLVGLRLK